MAFSEQQLKAQQAQLQQLENELSWLNNQFDAQMNAAGFTQADLAADESTLTPEQQEQWKEMQQAAKRAGAARAAQTQTGEASRSSMPGTGRRNIVRL